MRRGLLIVVMAGALLGCGGEIGNLAPASQTFDAVVNATPERVQPGQWVKFEVQLKNDFNKPMLVNLTLRLVEDATNKVVMTQVWDSVHFDRGEVYNITQNYLTATDIGRTAHRVELEAVSVETGEVVYTDSALTYVEFGT